MKASASTQRKIVNIQTLIPLRCPTAPYIAVFFLLVCSLRSFFRLSGSSQGISAVPLLPQTNLRGTDDRKERPFPRWWDDDENDPAGSQTLMLNILDFAHGTLARNATTIERPKTRSRWPEILYVIDRKGVWVSQAIRHRTWKLGLSRVVPVEEILPLAWKLLLQQDWQRNDERDFSSRWPMLHQAMKIQENEGMPFFIWYGDYTSCNRHNWMVAGSTTRRTIPLLTASAPINCTHAFPFPNYGTLDILQKDSTNWDAQLRNQKVDYPWDNKIRRVVWRGSLSAPNDDLLSIRWRLCRFVAELSEPGDQLLFDVGLVEIPSRHDHLQLNISLVGGLKEPIRPMKEFQQYKAILDVDGNSWSSRFAAILCSSSVVLKVEPMHVEYFYSELYPWKHFIPIRWDLSDLMERVRFVLDDGNESSVRAIIKNANEWCRTRLTYNASAAAMLDVLESYAAVLTRGSTTDWIEQWREGKPGILENANFQMRLLPLKLDTIS